MLSVCAYARYPSNTSLLWHYCMCVWVMRVCMCVSVQLSFGATNTISFISFVRCAHLASSILFFFCVKLSATVPGNTNKRLIDYYY